MSENDFIIYLIFPIIGTITGAILTYTFTGRFEKKRVITSIKIDLLRELLSMVGKINSLAIRINTAIILNKNEYRDSELTNDINKFMDESSNVIGYFNLNNAFFSKYKDLNIYFDNYDIGRSIFYSKIIDLFNNKNIQSVKKLLDNSPMIDFQKAGGIIMKNNYKNSFKYIVMLIPVVAGIIISIYLLYDISISLKINSNIDKINQIIDNLNKDNVVEFVEQIKTINVVDSAGMAIFSLLATVWVGLNIYNVIEKKELENLRQNVDSIYKIIKDSEKQMDSIIEKTDNKLSDYDNELNKIKKEYKVELSKELFYDAQSDFLNGNSYYIKVRDKFDKCFKLMDEENKTDIIWVYVIGSLDTALDITGLSMRIREENNYDENDARKLLECAYAVEHCVEKYEYLMIDDCIKKTLDDAILNYGTIKDILTTEKNKFLKTSIDNFKRIMDKSINKYYEITS